MLSFSSIRKYFIAVFFIVAFAAPVFAQSANPFGNTDSIVQKQFGQFIYNTNHDSMVQRVGNAIMKWAYATDFKIKFKLVKSDEINAFAYGDGNVYVMEGLFKTLSSENELAFVMGHEISHVTLKHYYKTQAYIDSSGETATEDSLRAFTREQEFEADKYGVLYAIRAGYTPLGGVNWFNAMTNLGFEYPPLHVSNYDHPNFTQRVVQAFINIGTYYEYAKHFDYGMIYLNTGEFQHAIASFTKFLEKYPHYKEAYNNIGVALLAKRLTDKNINLDLWLGAAVSRVQLFGDNFDKRVRGKYTVTDNDFSDAVANFKKALEYDPSYAQPYVNLALMSTMTGDFVKARKYIEQALKYDRKNVDAQMVIGFLNAEQNNFKEAVESFNKAYMLDLTNVKALFNLAYAYQWNKQKDDAITSWNSFLKAVPDGHYAQIAKKNLKELSGKKQEQPINTPVNNKSLNSDLSLGRIKLGETKESVQKKLKAPANKEAMEEGEVWEYYTPNCRIEFDDNGKVTMVQIFEDTIEGLKIKDKVTKIGTTEKEIIKAFGAPINKTEDGYYTTYDYSNDGFAFYLSEDEVVSILIYIP